MANKEKLQMEVYAPIGDLKNRFYNSKTQAEWDECKNELKTLYSKAKELLTPEFYKTYTDGINATISKMYNYKQKAFKKTPQQWPVKNSYIFQDNLANALTKFIELKTKMMELEYESKCNTRQAAEYSGLND